MEIYHGYFYTDNKKILLHIAGILILTFLYFAITLPFAYCKYHFDKEKTFIETWLDYTISFEKFFVIIIRVAFIIFSFFWLTLLIIEYSVAK